MKKLLCIIMAVFILTITSTTAYANSSRIISVSPGLSFDNNTACCSVMINGNSLSDVIRAVVRLCYEGERINVWYTSGEACLAFERTVDISDYGTGTYEITVDFTINDVSYERISMEREYQGG